MLLPLTNLIEPPTSIFIARVQMQLASLGRRLTKELVKLDIRREIDWPELAPRNGGDGRDSHHVSS